MRSKVCLANYVSSCYAFGRIFVPLTHFPNGAVQSTVRLRDIHRDRIIMELRWKFCGPLEASSEHHGSMQQAHYELRKHLKSDLPDFEEDEETMSDVDMSGDL